MHSFFAGHPLRARQPVEELELIAERKAKRDVQRQWEYWSPIVTGVVNITRSEYDAMSPADHRRLTAALSIQRAREKQAFEDATRK